MTLNYIWLALFIIGFIVATIMVILTGDGSILTNMMTGMFDSAKTGFEISIGLTGIMTFWLGIMKVGEKAGIIKMFSKGVAPFFRTIFKGVPKEDKAYGSVMMNFSANMLGLDNAATPLGLEAMRDLQNLNPAKETASDAQIMFLVLNTAGVTLIPTSVIAMRQAVAIEQGLVNFNAADIFLPTLIATFITFVAALFTVAIFQKINLFKLPVLLFLGGFGGVIAALFFYLKSLEPEAMANAVGGIGAGFILLIIALFFIAGAVAKQNVYNNFIEGAKEGFGVAIKIIPYLVAMLVAISAFRTSGCMDFVVNGISWGIGQLGFNTDFVPALPVAIMKSFSGSGARGIMVDVMKNYGVDSFQGKLAAIIQGSTETTFYVLAVYFGSVNIKNTRYAAVCGIIADVIGAIVAVIVAYAFYH